MKLSLSIKVLFRSPARTILTFVLLGVVMFALFSQSAEYAVTAREFDKAAKEYCGIGAIEAAPPPAGAFASQRVIRDDMALHQPDKIHPQ